MSVRGGATHLLNFIFHLRDESPTAHIPSLDAYLLLEREGVQQHFGSSRGASPRRKAASCWPRARCLASTLSRRFLRIRASHSLDRHAADQRAAKEFSIEAYTARAQSTNNAGNAALQSFGTSKDFILMDSFLHPLTHFLLELNHGDEPVEALSTIQPTPSIQCPPLLKLLTTFVGGDPANASRCAPSYSSQTRWRVSAF